MSTYKVAVAKFDAQDWVTGQPHITAGKRYSIRVRADAGPIVLWDDNGEQRAHWTRASFASSFDIVEDDFVGKKVKLCWFNMETGKVEKMPATLIHKGEDRITVASETDNHFVAKGWPDYWIEHKDRSTSGSPLDVILDNLDARDGWQLGTVFEAHCHLPMYDYLYRQHTEAAKRDLQRPCIWRKDGDKVNVLVWLGKGGLGVTTLGSNWDIQNLPKSEREAIYRSQKLDANNSAPLHQAQRTVERLMWEEERVYYETAGLQ